MTNLEAKKALCRKLNIEWDDISNNDLFTAEDIQDFVSQGAMEAWDYYDWDFAEHSKTSTLDSTDITNEFVPYPKDIAPSSIYYVVINGEVYQKKDLASYMKWFVDRPDDDSKIWAEYKRKIFFNTNVVEAGNVIDIYGKIAMSVLSADADLMPFSPDEDNKEYSGNQACVELAYALALASDKKKNPSQAEVERKKAYEKLDRLVAQQQKGRSQEQIKNKPMFDVPDYFSNSNSRSENGRFNN